MSTLLETMLNPTENNPRVQPMGKGIVWHVWNDAKGSILYKEVNTKTGTVSETQFIELIDRSNKPKRRK